MEAGNSKGGGEEVGACLIEPPMVGEDSIDVTEPRKMKHRSAQGRELPYNGEDTHFDVQHPGSLS